MTELGHLRRKKILEMLRSKGKIFVMDLRREFGVTNMTIRRDLRDLEDQGLLKCVHGGAVLPEAGTNELLFSSRQVLNADLKKAIGSQAAKFVIPGMTIFIDGSTTGLVFARMIKNIRNLCVVTDSLSVFFELQRTTGLQTMLLGGVLEADENTLGGDFALENISRMYFNCCFFSVAGFDTDGIYNSFPTGVAVKRAVIEQSSDVILMADSSKYGRKGSWKICGWEKIKTFICDKNLSAEAKIKIEAMNVNIKI